MCSPLGGGSRDTAESNRSRSLFTLHERGPRSNMHTLDLGSPSAVPAISAAGLWRGTITMANGAQAINTICVSADTLPILTFSVF